MKRLFSAFLIFLGGGFAALFADYNPPDGGEELYDLISPLFLAGGPGLASPGSALSAAINPAAPALLQRVSLEGSYTGLADFDGEGWEGHGVNLGVSYPSKYGVLSGSAQYLDSTLDQMFLGRMGTLRFSFSKDLFPELLVGAGLHATAGGAGRAGGGDFGVAADLGFIYFPGEFFGLEKFHWGAAVRNLGKWYAPVDGRSAFPSPFTPALGAGFTVFRSESLELELTGDLVFPSCRNFRVDGGAAVTLREWITLRASTRFDLRQAADDDLARRSMVPAFGLAAVFNIDLDIKAARRLIRENEWEHSDVKLQAAGAPLHKGIWAFGLGAILNLGLTDTNPPLVQADYP
jgi:hypothetical protein